MEESTTRKLSTSKNQWRNFAS